MSGTDPSTIDTNEAEDDRRSRSYETIGTILLVITVIVVALLLWRSCDTADTADGASEGEAYIQEFDTLEHVDDVVSVWLDEDATIETVLDRNGLSNANFKDMGEGTYVIEIGDADCAATVKKLKSDPGLKDAGFIYQEAAQD
ncbi:MAG: hypothetical protein ACYC6C_10085 [Coriobacteriia bacterium]